MVYQTLPNQPLYFYQKDIIDCTLEESVLEFVWNQTFQSPFFCPDGAQDMFAGNKCSKLPEANKTFEIEFGGLVLSGMS